MTCWKFRFVLDPRLHDTNFLCLSFFTFHSSSLWRNDTTMFVKLNKPPPPRGEFIEDLPYSPDKECYPSIFNFFFSNSENGDHLKIFRNVYCVVTNSSKDQDTRANSVAVCMQFTFLKPHWLFPRNSHSTNISGPSCSNADKRLTRG